MQSYDIVMRCFLKVSFRESFYKVSTRKSTISFSWDGKIVNAFLRGWLQTCLGCYVLDNEIRYVVWAYLWILFNVLFLWVDYFLNHYEKCKFYVGKDQRKLEPKEHLATKAACKSKHSKKKNIENNNQRR